LHLDLVPVAGVGEYHLRGSLTPAQARSASAAQTIGSRCPKSGESTVTSAAMTICSAVTAAWAL
jgi:hypothetical protein